MFFEPFTEYISLRSMMSVLTRATSYRSCICLWQLRQNTASGRQCAIGDEVKGERREARIAASRITSAHSPYLIPHTSSPISHIPYPIANTPVPPTAGISIIIQPQAVFCSIRVADWRVVLSATKQNPKPAGLIYSEGRSNVRRTL